MKTLLASTIVLLGFSAQAEQSTFKMSDYKSEQKVEKEERKPNSEKSNTEVNKYSEKRFEKHLRALDRRELRYE